MISLITFAGGNATAATSAVAGLFPDLTFASSRCLSPRFCCLLNRRVSMKPSRYRFSMDTSFGNGNGSEVEKEMEVRMNYDDDDIRKRDERRISGIHVPRQKHIPVSKTELLDAILEMFESKEDADNFVKFCLYLDFLLHAEHKGILEEIRSYYSSSHLQEQSQRTKASTQQEEASFSFLSSDDSMVTNEKETNTDRNAEDDKPLHLHDSLDLRSFFGYFSCKAYGNSGMDSQRVDVATRFQQSLMKLLQDAQFEELSAQDFLLTYALNSDYLLTLPIYVDWKRASESHAIIFRRGYATERQNGLLIAEKVDYLQSKLLQEIFFNLSRPLKYLGKWLYEALRGSSKAQRVADWIDKVKLWFKDQYSLERTWSHGFSGNHLRSDSTRDSDLPIWLAAQRAAPQYEGFLSFVGPRGRLMKELLNWVGLVPSTPDVSVHTGTIFSETALRPNFLQRITLSNIWEPASSESCGNNIWKMLKTAVSILFSRSILQEPAFQELILLYSEDPSQREDAEKDVLPLYLKIYERIPIPDLPVIFPYKKLSFRILDTVRLDIASILGLLAFFLNYKFENILSSPSAVLLDVIATTALILYVSRVVLGYKQTWDRYQLLVNRILHEKTLASGFGSVHFLLDASEEQQYKEAILLYAILLHPEKYQVLNRKSIAAECEMFMHEKLNEMIEMPINKAMDTLLRFDIVFEFPLEGNLKPKALPCFKACETLRRRWNSMLDPEP